jgi:hypothetical protein
MQVTINGGCMDISANPRMTDKEKVVQVVNLIVSESNNQIVVAAEQNDAFECWFTLSWKKKWYTVEEAREIYTTAKKNVLEKK